MKFFLPLAILVSMASPFYAQDSISIPLIRQHIIDITPPQIQESLSAERELFRFADQSAFYIHGLFKRGQILEDFDKYETYINEVLQRVLPEELKDDQMVHAYLRHKSSYNAGMTAAGLAFINIGVFAQVENESVLAGILAHEIAHYYQHHSLSSFSKSNNGDFRPNLLFKNNSRSRFSILNELSADNLAMKWMLESGYNLKGLIDGFKIMQNLESNIIDRSSSLVELEATTHPLSDDRLANMMSFLEEHTTRTGQNAFVNEAIFNELSHISKSLVLEDLMNNLAYTRCIEQAFKYHIQDPSNPEYIYTLLEAVRRKCYMFPENWNEYFITSDYYKKPDDFGQKLQRSDHIFESFPYQILNMPEGSIEDLPGKFYWNGDLKFKTYEEAFIFFMNVADKFGIKEAQLSNALSFSGADELMNTNLDLYLANTDIKNREYAQALKDGTIYSNLPDKKLTVFSDFTFIVRQGTEDIIIREENTPIKPQLDSIYAKVSAGFIDRDFMVLDEIKEQDIELYRFLYQLEYISLVRTISKGKTYLHILDPKFYEVYKNLGVNEIEFVNFTFLEAQKNSELLEDYEAVLELDYEGLLNKTKCTRYTEGFVSSVRIKENSLMKVRHYVNEIKLKFKDPGYDETIKILKAALRDIDVKAEQRDREFRKYN